MFKTIASIGLGAMMVLAPLGARAQTYQTSAPAASTANPSSAHASSRTGSFRSQMRHRSNLSRERARASAEHMRHIHTTPKT
jgi:hypothetical protein